MRAFACPQCRAFVAFEADVCAHCHTPLGFHLRSKEMVELSDGAATIDGQRWIRCTQAATWDCNWLAAAESTYERGRCLADSLIRREPDADDTLAREKLADTICAPAPAVSAVQCAQIARGTAATA